MKQCKNCLLPETHDSIHFDENGVCNICNQVKQKNMKIDWNVRGQWLQDIISQYKGKYAYDCIVPFSGGKDSTFQLYYIVRELGLRPLVIRYDHWGFRPLVEENNENVFKQLGVDVLKFTPDWHLIKAIMLEALKETGDFCWHCHTGILGNTMQLSVKFEVPLIVWGESAAEYTSYRNFEDIIGIDEDFFNKVISLNVGIDQMRKEFADSFGPRCFDIFEYPSKEEIKRVGCRPIYLGDYIQWDTKRHCEVIKKELGWKGQDVEGIPPEYDYEKIECKWQGIRDYCRYIKRGYGRTSHLAAIDIRSGRLSTKEGRLLVEKYDGKRPKSLNLFFEYTGHNRG